MKGSLLSLLFCSLFVGSFSQANSFKELPIQNGGRIKPLDTLARESMRLIYGKEKYDKKEPSVLVLTIVLAPEIWRKTKFIQLKNRNLKKALGLNEQVDYFSQEELQFNPALPSMVQNLQTKRKKKAKENAFDQAVGRLESQLVTLSLFQSGEIFIIEPPAVGDTSTKKWKSIVDLSPEFEEDFKNIVEALSKNVGGVSNAKLLELLDKKAAPLKEKIWNRAAAKGQSASKAKVEVIYNSFKPFRWSWIFYLLGLVLMFGYWIFSRNFLKVGFLSFVSLGFFLHLLGFIMRIYISNRAPVSNMYETILWVPFGTIIFGIIIGRWGKNLFAFVGSCVVAVFCLILADMSPTIFDPSIQPLEAVLRSNFWLTTHVLTITISYSAFFLAFILGDFSLFYHLNENKYRKQIADLNLSIYRSVQIGVLLLAVGVVLGGIWADYSWGRFWGWDPKETWAFIALMGYLALLHGRLVGMIKSFGMAAGSVLAFSLVIMAWYGVNFWLGAGLHSYGFGSGGVEYAFVFVLSHILFVIFSFVYKTISYRTVE